MRLDARRRARLRARDLAALSAYAPVGLSGAVPAWVSAVFAVSFLTSLTGRRPLARGRLWSAIVLSIVALVLFGLAFKGLIDLVVAAVSFASLVAAHRLVSEPSEATNQQVLLSSLLLIAGGAALSGEMWFSLCLLAFGTFACLHLGLTVVEGPVERDEELPVRPVIRQVAIGVGIALLGAVAFFILFPRLSWNIASRRTAPSLLGATTGLADRLRLGGGGDIKTNARTVLKASLQPDPGVEHLGRYWVGRRFDTFDGKEWRGSGVARPPATTVRLRALEGPRLTQQIEVLPAYGSRTLVGLEEPTGFAVGVRLSSLGGGSVRLVEARGEEVRATGDAATFSYTVVSADGPRTEADDEAQPRALQLPPLDPRIAPLSREAAGGETEPRRAARRVEQWLKASYGYTLELGEEVDDPLAAFLFDRREGHCEHFATALAVMLRAQGIPARVTAGFYGGLRVGDRYAVRAGDAHAWVEAWLGDEGWVTLDATPEQGRSGQPPAVWAVLADAYERLEELWRQRVLDYGFMDQLGFLRTLVRPPRSSATGSPAGPDAPDRARPLPWRLLGLALLVPAALLLRALLTRRPSRHAATSFLERLERRLARVGVGRQALESVEELSRRLSAERHELAPAVARATRRYLEARFGGRGLSRAEEAALLAGIAAGPLKPQSTAPVRRPLR